MRSAEEQTETTWVVLGSVAHDALGFGPLEEGGSSGAACSSRVGRDAVFFHLPVEMATLDPKLFRSSRHIPSLRPQFGKNELAFEGVAGLLELKLSGLTIG